ncbi:MAG: hypothetical protein H6765_06050 [Candidatus Peribacteria bacterium]|nr:MAG: hypothetical protein H6765_06050 [Candidatus Peribacteria bacterium]
MQVDTSYERTSTTGRWFRKETQTRRGNYNSNPQFIDDYPDRKKLKHTPMFGDYEFVETLSYTCNTELLSWA